MTRILAAALVLLGVLLGIQTYRIATIKEGIAEERQAWQQERAEASAAAASASEAYRQQEARWRQEQQEKIDALQPALDAARTAAAGLPGLSERLRNATASLAACRRGPAIDSPAAPGSAPAADTERVLAELRRELDDAEEARTRYADEASAAGRRCELSYDALR
jgi:hypothetical protein